MSIRTNILVRVYLAFGLILLFAGAVVFQLCRVQFAQGKKMAGHVKGAVYPLQKHRGYKG